MMYLDHDAGDETQQMTRTITVNYFNLTHDWSPTPQFDVSLVSSANEVGVTINGVAYPSVQDIPDDVLRGRGIEVDESSREK